MQSDAQAATKPQHEEGLAGRRMQHTTRRRWSVAPLSPRPPSQVRCNPSSATRLCTSGAHLTAL